MVVSSPVEQIFNETAMHARAQASNRLARANTASHGPRVRAKERVKQVRENHKENPKGPKVRSRVKPRKLVYQVLKNRNQRQAQKLRNLQRRIPLTILTRTIPGVMMAGETMNGMTGVRMDGMKVGIKLTTTPQDHLEVSILVL